MLLCGHIDYKDIYFLYAWILYELINCFHVLLYRYIDDEGIELLIIN